MLSMSPKVLFMLEIIFREQVNIFSYLNPAKLEQSRWYSKSKAEQSRLDEVCV